MKPTQEEIDNLLTQCKDAENAGTSKFPNMTYKQGLIEGIEWVLGMGSNTNPLED